MNIYLFVPLKYNTNTLGWHYSFICKSAKCYLVRKGAGEERVKSGGREEETQMVIHTLSKLYYTL
jgi:hypothetical protein